jgi:hypothetical protein
VPDRSQKAADAFAPKVLPIVRQIQAADVSGLQSIANALKTVACALPEVARGTTARCAICWCGDEKGTKETPLQPLHKFIDV